MFSQIDSDARGKCTPAHFFAKAAPPKHVTNHRVIRGGCSGGMEDMNLRAAIDAAVVALENSEIKQDDLRCNDMRLNDGNEDNNGWHRDFRRTLL